MARKKKETNEGQLENLKVRVELDAVTVSILANPNDQEELQKAIKEAFIKQISEKFPFYRYGINTADALTQEDVFVGRIIKDKEKERFGIITGINAKTINVGYPGAIVSQGVPECWVTTEIKEKDFDRIIELFKRPSFLLTEVDAKDETKIKDTTSLNIWQEGCTGYIIVKNEVIPVVMGKSSGKKYKFYPINKKGGFYELSEMQLQLVNDTREQAEKKLKK